MARETLDIEKVVEWAYRVQCVDRQPRGPVSVASVASISGGLGQYLSLGTRVDNSGAATMALGVRVPDDATLIHDAVLALDNVYLEWRARDVVEVWDATSAAERGMAIWRKDETVWMAPAYEIGTNPTEPVALETVSASVLVILNGRHGGQPEWHPDWRPSSRTFDGDPDRREVMHARAVYLAWRLTLCRLAKALSGRLRDFDVTMPAALEAPWKAHQPRVVDDQTTQRAVKRTAPRRKRA